MMPRLSSENADSTVLVWMWVPRQTYILRAVLDRLVLDVRLSSCDIAVG